MGRWVIEKKNWQQILTHYCDSDAAKYNPSSDALRQDIGGGYVRCDHCGDKFLPQEEPGNPRLLLRLKSNAESGGESGK